MAQAAAVPAAKPAALGPVPWGHTGKAGNVFLNYTAGSSLMPRSVCAHKQGLIKVQIFLTCLDKRSRAQI